MWHMLKKIELSKIWIMLGCVVIAGTALRLHNISTKPLWLDEFESYEISSGSIEDIIMRKHDVCFSPPGYFLILHGFMRYLGDSESALRLPSVICGTLSMIAIYFLGKRLYSHREGLIAAAFMAISLTPIWYSQEARQYSLLILGTIVSAYLYIPLIKDDEIEISFPVGYVIISIALCYLHYFGLIFVMIQTASLLIVSMIRQKRRFFTLLLFAIILITYVPWIPSMIDHYLHSPFKPI